MKLHGAFAEFATVESFLAATRKVRDAGYKKWDTHTPFAVHGVDEAMGITPTHLPWLVLGAGLTGLGGATLMIWWMNAVDYPIRAAGKPFFTLPSSVPIMFECTILLAAFAAFLGMLALNDLPLHHRPWFASKRFRRTTSDRFVITIDAADPLWDAKKTVEFLRSLGGVGVEEVAETEGSVEPPRFVLFAGIVVAIAATIPFLLFARARLTTSESPRIHIFTDMDFQEKKKAQTASTLFADGRAEREPIDGTIARGSLQEDGAFFRGAGRTTTFTATFPAAVKIDDALMLRGRDKFETFCMPCHGVNGEGDGLVARRADELKDKGGWVPLTSLQDARIKTMPVGQIFDTVSKGARTMPAYGPQIAPADRWAIVLYVRALERSQGATPADVPAGAKIEDAPKPSETKKDEPKKDEEHK